VDSGEYASRLFKGQRRIVLPRLNSEPICKKRAPQPPSPRGLAPGVVLGGMRDEFPVTCPFCGEQVEIYIEPDARGTFVQDCEVCCNPWRVRISGQDDDRVVHVTRADGSE